MVVNSAQDLGGMPATSYPADAATENKPKTEPEPSAPKPSTIKIQTPTDTKTEDKKDDMAVLALRQASSEAAFKAKAKSDDKKEPTKEPASEERLSNRAHRGSVAPELPDTEPDSPKNNRRPTLVPEQAAVSSANFHADNAEMLGLVAHHRGSRVSTLEDADQDKALRDIRQSIHAEEPTGNLEALRKEAAEKTRTETIEEVPSPIGDDVVTENKEELMEPNEPKGNAIAEVIAKSVEPEEFKAELAKEANGAKSTEDEKDDTKAGQVPKSAE
jgi:hypothetical protein